MVVVRCSVWPLTTAAAVAARTPLEFIIKNGDSISRRLNVRFCACVYVVLYLYIIVYTCVRVCVCMCACYYIYLLVLYRVRLVRCCVFLRHALIFSGPFDPCARSVPENDPRLLLLLYCVLLLAQTNGQQCVRRSSDGGPR